MSPQSTSIRWCDVTLAANVRLFSFLVVFLSVYFQISPQTACIKGCKVTLVALLWFFSFIICVSRGNIFICPIFTEVIICNILIHQNQVENVVRWNCQFQTEKIRRENKWKWELLLKTPDQTRTDNRDNDRRQRQQYKDKKSNDTKFDDKNTKAKKYSGQIKWQQNTTTTYINKNKNKDFPQDILYI